MPEQVTATTEERLTIFANKHQLVFKKGEVGFCRPCVGFAHGDSFVAHNPFDYETLEPIPDFEDDRLNPPDGVGDAYHKHDCLCVLVEDDNYDAAMGQLLTWVRHLESIGELEVAHYKTGATGAQLLMVGVLAKAIRFKDRP